MLNIRSKYMPFKLQKSIFFILIVLGFAQCNQTKIYPSLPIQSLYTQINNYGITNEIITVNEVDSIQLKFGSFFTAWLSNIFAFPPTALQNDSLIAEMLTIHYKKNKTIYTIVDKHYKQYPKLQQQISNAFGELNKQLPQLQIPQIYAYFSEFSNTTTFSFAAKNTPIVAYGAESFLNDTFKLYALIQDYPNFMRQRYSSTNSIPSTLILNYVKSNFEAKQASGNMVDEMFFQGKLWYTVETVIKSKDFYKHLGYTQQDWDFFIQNEGQIWNHFIQSNALFSSNYKDYFRYFNYGNNTFGSGIPQNCPPRVGCFSGYKLVKNLMQKQKLTLAQLWQITNGSKALQQSAYSPKR